MQPVHWGIAGFGWVARDYMAPAIIEAGHRLEAICDPSPAARRAAERLGARIHADVGALARDGSIEAVYVATPNDLHRPVVESLAQQSKAILCEKPIAHCLADAEAMIAVCRERQVLFGTAFDQRHHPAHAALRRHIAGGTLGRVTAIRIVYACWLGPDWTTGTGENWRADPARAGGGAVIDLAPHGLDLVEYLLGEPLVDLSVMLQQRVHDYPVDDGGVLIGRSGSGVLASLHVAYNCPQGLPRRRLEILGTRGQLTALDTMGQDAGGQIWQVDGTAGDAAAIVVPDIATSPFVNQVRAFSAAVRGAPHDYSAERDLAGMRRLAGALARATPATTPRHGRAAAIGEHAP